MSTRPLHSLASGAYPRTEGLSPLGLPCPEHASMTLDGKCYWHTKAAHLRGEHVPLVARRWCGFDLPQPDPGWNADRGWRSAEDVLRAVTRNEEREAEFRGLRWLVDLGGETRELMV